MLLGALANLETLEFLEESVSMHSKRQVCMERRVQSGLGEHVARIQLCYRIPRRWRVFDRNRLGNWRVIRFR